jgi:hypothetical protein
MEEELTRNRLKTDAIEAALQNILAKLDAPRVNENAMYEEPSSGRAELAEEAENNVGESESEVLRKLSRVKPATPPDFDGDREKGRAFLNTCSIYFAICGSLFPNDQARIHWTLSYFKSDRAARFANKVIRSVSKGKGNYFKDWEEFENTFVDQFCPKNEQLTALTKLEGTGWYQGKDPVDDYIDRFQELIDLAEYDDDKTIVIKFRRGLDPTLQNQVALLGDGAPDFDDPEGWYKAARKVARNREANEAFVETSRWTSRSSARSAPTPLRQGSVFAPIRRQLPSFAPPPPVRNSTPPPSKNGPAPMDIDHAKGKGNPAVTCFRCRKTGHYARECPQAFDIRLMTTAEKLELLPEFLALADVIGDPPAENPSESAEHGAEEAEEAEDFAIRSR